MTTAQPQRCCRHQSQAPMLALANQRWNLDFPHVEMASGRGFRVLKVVDDVTRERLAAVLDASILERRVTSERTRPISERGKPRLIVSDNGSELTSNAVLASCEAFVVDWHFIAPG